MVPLKYLSNFWRTLEMPLSNSEINLILTSSTNSAVVSTNVANQNATFEITDTKLYVPVVTLSTQENSKLLHQLKSGFNPHMHKMGPRRPKHYIFGNQFNSKNARGISFNVLFHFNARKHMISSFYLKWTEFIRNCKFFPI